MIVSQNGSIRMEASNQGDDIDLHTRTECPAENKQRAQQEPRASAERRSRNE